MRNRDYESREEREVFDLMAERWYSARHYSIFRTELTALATRWRNGRLLNVGCGHGADFLPFKEGFMLHGLDFSSAMINMARRYARKFELAANLIVGDARALPFARGSFDWAIAIATYHHIQSQDQRLEALRELKRVLRPSGEAFVTVWNHWQPSFWYKRRDLLVPWRTTDGVVQRYYHMFTYQELESLARRAGFTILQSFAESSYHLPIRYFSRNICLLLKNSVEKLPVEVEDASIDCRNVGRPNGRTEEATGQRSDGGLHQDWRTA